LVNAWLILLTPVAEEADCPVTSVLLEIVQVYVVFKGTTVAHEVVGVIVNADPLQIVTV